ncbi:META domain-containing protein [Frigidibacter albus]|uniref:META domain-containing protein n=1 Tax=Frigidibacter albus TaxID=1465486 RepID=A0A6L8VH83_9RHOB|nr:META domain-containing protein [Frigidibacter albus]MZQ88570.1 META domain-containing protein [Frigidibacter albus]NBE30621.1 META domain-containing protein [Frigidibacter albus]GGH49218.1 HslJ [Frigidibacter albus]
MRLALVLAALLAASPALAERLLTGSASYPQRIALPEGADLALDLTDASGALVAELRQPLQGAQVPLPFTLTAPDDALTLQAAVLVGGAPMWVSETLAIPAGTDPTDLGILRLRPHRPMGFATRFRCGEAGLELGYTAEGARLRIGATYFDLAAGEPGTFTDAADPGTFATVQGNTLNVSLRGTPLPACHPELPGFAPFRATGTEPGWSLVIEAGTVTYTGDYGAVTLTGDLPAPEASSGPNRRYVLAEGLAFSVVDQLCRDAATGMPFPATVAVETADAVLPGCGGDPAALLAGVTWQVEDIGGRGIPDNAAAMLTFLPLGRVAGRTGCNTFTGGAELTGEGLRFGPAALTRMACPPALTRMEADFLSALQETDRFDFTPDGALQLIGGDRVLLTARF